jgi:hypothetical protein
LREPVAAEAVARFVETFVDAWRRESLEDLAALLSNASDAGPLEARGRGREAIMENWRQRLKGHPHEYAALGGDLVAMDRIERWDVDSAHAAPGNGGGADVFVSAPVDATWTGVDRLFKNYLVMVLRREPGGFRIVAYGETDERPTH